MNTTTIVKAANGLAWLLLAGCWLPTTPAQAQAPTWETAVSATGGTGAAWVQATAADANGNVYLGGHFTRTVSLGATVLTSAGSEDAFVAKWSSASRSFVWARQVSGGNAEEVAALAVSGSSVYVLGRFLSNTATLGSISLQNAGNTGTGVADDIFVAKLTDAGATASFVWARALGGNGSESGRALAVDGPNVYVAGNSTSASLTVGTTTFTNQGAVDALVVKLVDAGGSAQVAWAQQVAGSGSELVSALAVSGGQVYVGGYFSSPNARFGTLAVGATGANLFVARLNDAGASSTFAWVVQAGGSPSREAQVNALVATGATVYVAGYFENASLALGATTLANTDATLTVDSRDLFVGKLTDQGSSAGWTWATKAGGPGYDWMTSLVGRGRYLYLGGSFTAATAQFGGTALANVGTASSSSVGDAFVARLSDAGPTGAFDWALAAGGRGNDYTTGLALGPDRLYVAGTVGPPAQFGGIALTSGSTFLASVADAAVLATPAPASPAAPHLYPNPSSGRVAVRGLAARAEVTAFDSLGRPVATATADATGQAQLALPAGLYLVRSGTSTSKLVVE